MFAKSITILSVLAACGGFLNAQEPPPPPPGGGLAPPPGFSVTLTKATGGQKKISSNGTYVCPDTHEVIAAVLILNRVDGGADPTPPVITSNANGTWTVTDAAVAAGTYDVYARFTFRKKNPQVGDIAFDVGSNVELNVVVSP